MNQKRFDEILARSGFGFSKTKRGRNRTVYALRLHLVDGWSVPEAARLANISHQVLYRALERFPLERCPHCGQPVKKDQPTMKAHP